MSFEANTLEALNALVHLGASDTLLGMAVRELIAGDRTGQPGPGALGIDLSAPPRSAQGAASLQSDKDEERPSNVAKVPSPSPPSRPRAAASPLVSMESVRRKNEIIAFRTLSGERTSVGFVPADWVKLTAAFEGDVDTVRALVRTTAPNAPSAANRSKWTFEELMHQSKQ